MLKEKLKTLKESLRNAKREDIDINKVIDDSKQGLFDEKNIAAIIRYKHEIFPELINTAIKVNEKFNKIIDFYAVSYVSDKCVNYCKYCGHRRTVKNKRKTLDNKEMALDFSNRLKFGPSEICILTGEHPSTDVDFLKESRRIAINEDKHHRLETICFNVAPMSLEKYELLNSEFSDKTQIRVFQESYDEKTYLENHLLGPKRDFEFRLLSQDRAIQAGIKSVGIGTLLGLNKENSPYEHFGNDFEIMSLIRHAFHLKETYGLFPVTASIPRHQKYEGSDFNTPNPVDNLRYLLYHAIMRINLPETKIIITVREKEELRDVLRPMINIEDLAARPGVGGNYKMGSHFQNELGDSREPEELIEDIVCKGYKPNVLRNV